MEPYIADFLANRSIPRLIRYAVLFVLVAFIEVIVIFAGVSSPFLWGRIACAVIGVLMLAAGIFAAVYRIHKN
ncbi:MAG: hypothetical protein IJ746_06800 [Ruminococcus sp.]|nr:hypothetical protein [Ruminococcus sp.]